ncbi:MAG: biotin-dependent carboxyltransferase family protein [Pseudomonadota bacterium]
MSLHILAPGVQTTIQAAPRIGLRHIGIPASGPMDRLSHALANRLVGNELHAPALEITLGGLEARVEADCRIARTGADGPHTIDGDPLPSHRAIELSEGQMVSVGYPEKGCRSYLAIGGGFKAEEWLGSMSTYLPAETGGYNGRAIKAGDHLEGRGMNTDGSIQLQTPLVCRPPISTSWALRAVPGPDATDEVLAALFNSKFFLSNRTSRMGGALEGVVMGSVSKPTLPSAAVFPGTVQCPEDGQPFMLMADAQTTGGYPIIAQVVRADRHLMGQIRPGDSVRLLPTDPAAAADVLKQKSAIFSEWLGCAFQLG